MHSQCERERERKGKGKTKGWRCEGCEGCEREGGNESLLLLEQVVTKFECNIPYMPFPSNNTVLNTPNGTVTNNDLATDPSNFSAMTEVWLSSLFFLQLESHLCLLPSPSFPLFPPPSFLPSFYPLLPPLAFLLTQSFL